MRKAIIYLRTSTKEQNPELQLKQCKDFAITNNLEVMETISEQGSAYKIEKIRTKWEKAIEKAKSEKLDIVLWKYDRSFRNREEFFKFMKVMFEVYGTKVYSVTEPSILSFWNLLDTSNTGNPIFDELLKNIFKAMWDFMIQQAGEQAEEESRKKSERVKLAVRKDNNGKTKSYKGNKWGRKTISTQKLNKIKQYYKEKPKSSVRQAEKELGISKSVIHKYLKDIKEIEKESKKIEESK